MNEAELSQSARENLGTIRRLMERATVYRVISAVPALTGGVLGVMVGLVLAFRSEPLTHRDFVLTWLAVYLVVDAINVFVLYREARNRGAAFPSSQLRYAVGALLPAMVTCGLIGVLFAWFREQPVSGVLMWAVGYGLGLLATAAFAPRSIRVLGLSFLAAALAAFGWLQFGATGDAESLKTASLLMAGTFGGFHVIYGVVVGWLSRDSAA